MSDETVQEDRTTKYSDLDSLNVRSNFTNDQSSITVDDSSNDSDSKTSSAASDTSTSSSNSFDCSSKSSDMNKRGSSSSSDESNYEQQHQDEENLITNLLSNIEQNSDGSEKMSTFNVKTEEMDLNVKIKTTNETASLSYTCLNNEQVTESNVCEPNEALESINNISELQNEYQEISLENQMIQKIEDLKLEAEPKKEEIEPEVPKEIKSESIEVVKIEPEKFVAVDLMDEGSEKKSMALGFESTMDDISDNELESFLQELEDLEQEQQKQKICDKQSDKDVCDNISEASTIDINDPRIESLDTTMKTETGDYPGFTESELPENRSDVDLIKAEESIASESPIEEASSMNMEESEAKSTNPEEPEEAVENPPERPKTLDIKTENLDDPSKIQIDSDQGLTSTSSEEFSAMVSTNDPIEENSENSGKIAPNINGIDLKELGSVPPFWVPDETSTNCMQCNLKFSVIKRRHHCRSCGLLLCSGCCSSKAKLPYLDDAEARVCAQCDGILKRNKEALENPDNGNSPRQPNPNNPMEYCSVVPPHEQVSPHPVPTMSVMVPVSVLKKRESNGSSKSERKNVMFSDGIRPGCDLSELDENWNMKPSSSSGSRSSRSGRVSTPTGSSDRKNKFQANYPVVDERNKSFIPSSGNQLPPIYTRAKTEHKYSDVTNDETLIERLKLEELKFAVQKNFYVVCKIVKCKEDFSIDASYYFILSHIF